MKPFLPVVFTFILASASFGQTSTSIVGFIESNCRTEIDRFCQGVTPGGGALTACLRQHQSELSAQCADALRTLN